jgi:hypothetical protein
LRYGGILCEHFYLWWTTSGGEALPMVEGEVPTYGSTSGGRAFGNVRLRWWPALPPLLRSALYLLTPNLW